MSLTKYGTYKIFECNNCHIIMNCLMGEDPQCDCQNSKVITTGNKIGTAIIYGYTRREDLEELEADE